MKRFVVVHLSDYFISENSIITTESHVSHDDLAVMLGMPYAFSGARNDAIRTPSSYVYRFASCDSKSP